MRNNVLNQEQSGEAIVMFANLERHAFCIIQVQEAISRMQNAKMNHLMARRRISDIIIKSAFTKSLGSIKLKQRNIFIILGGQH